MSGGSLGYLYNRDAAELMEATNYCYLKEVERRLIELEQLDVAKDVRRLIEYILTARNRIDVLAENLSDVFHAVEWWINGDYGDEELFESIEKYRRGETNEQ